MSIFKSHVQDEILVAGILESGEKLLGASNAGEAGTQARSTRAILLRSSVGGVVVGVGVALSRSPSAIVLALLICLSVAIGFLLFSRKPAGRTFAYVLGVTDKRLLVGRISSTDRSVAFTAFDRGEIESIDSRSSKVLGVQLSTEVEIRFRDETAPLAVEFVISSFTKTFIETLRRLSPPVIAKKVGEP